MIGTLITPKMHPKMTNLLFGPVDLSSTIWACTFVVDPFGVSFRYILGRLYLQWAMMALGKSHINWCNCAVCTGTRSILNFHGISAKQYVSVEPVLRTIFLGSGSCACWFEHSCQWELLNNSCSIEIQEFRTNAQRWQKATDRIINIDCVIALCR